MRPLQAGDDVGLVEVVADEAEAALGMELPAVVGDDAGGFLAAMLERVQAERGDGGGIGVAEDAEDAALLAQPVVAVARERQTVDLTLGGSTASLECRCVAGSWVMCTSRARCRRLRPLRSSASSRPTAAGCDSDSAGQALRAASYSSREPSMASVTNRLASVQEALLLAGGWGRRCRDWSATRARTAPGWCGTCRRRS